MDPRCTENEKNSGISYAYVCGNKLFDIAQDGEERWEVRGVQYADTLHRRGNTFRSEREMWTGESAVDALRAKGGR